MKSRDEIKMRRKKRIDDFPVQHANHTLTARQEQAPYLRFFSVELQRSTGEIRIYPTGYDYSQAHFNVAHDDALGLYEGTNEDIAARCATVLADVSPYSRGQKMAHDRKVALRTLEMLRGDGYYSQPPTTAEEGKHLPSHGDQWYLSSLHGRVVAGE